MALICSFRNQAQRTDRELKKKSKAWYAVTKNKTWQNYIPSHVFFVCSQISKLFVLYLWNPSDFLHLISANHEHDTYLESWQSLILLVSAMYGTRHVLVLGDFPPSTRTTDLEKVLESFKDRFVIRWVNDTTALAVFRTPSIGTPLVYLYVLVLWFSTNSRHEEDCNFVQEKT